MFVHTGPRELLTYTVVSPAICVWQAPSCPGTRDPTHLLSILRVLGGLAGRAGDTHWGIPLVLVLPLNQPPLPPLRELHTYEGTRVSRCKRGIDIMKSGILVALPFFFSVIVLTCTIQLDSE